MSKQALSYILNTNILSNERLKIYYDFDTGSVSIYQSGTYYIPYLKNTFPKKVYTVYRTSIVIFCSWHLLNIKYFGNKLDHFDYFNSIRTLRMENILFNVHFEVTLAKTIAGVIITGDQLPVTATPLAIIYF